MSHEPGRVPRDLIEEAVEAVAGRLGNSSDVELRERYSGRGMFGERCFGIDVDSESTFSVFLIEVTARDADLARKLSRAVRSDSMGLGRIYYFPGYLLDGEPA